MSNNNHNLIDFNEPNNEFNTISISLKDDSNTKNVPNYDVESSINTAISSDSKGVSSNNTIISIEKMEYNTLKEPISETMV